MTHFYDARQWRESWRWGFPEPRRALDTDSKGYLVRLDEVKKKNHMTNPRHLMMWSSVLWLPVRFHEYSVGLVPVHPSFGSLLTLGINREFGFNLLNQI